ncbi:MAG: ATP-binding protein [Bacteroidaceae bacterium]|nr:ATP-binding protein [Bacteroidaceae bacterium]
MEHTSCDFVRYLYPRIQWEERLIGIRGARGVGKTTMMLQRIKMAFPDTSKAFYASLDNIWFAGHSLTELVEYLYTHGVTHLFADEVHRYRTWAVELKNIFDSYPDFNVVFTGSSLLQLEQGEADLSRRPHMYDMAGLSLREYMMMNGIADLPVLTVEDILERHVQIAASIAAQVKVLPAFERYFTEGYYPFRKETADKAGYQERIERVVQTVIENDIPAVEEVSYETLQKMKRLMVVLAGLPPFTPKISSLCQTIDTTRNQLIRLLGLMERASLIRQIRIEGKGLKMVGKPDKVLIDNANIMAAITSAPDEGSMREAYFTGQMAVGHCIKQSRQGDFLIDDTYLFEVGGAKKGFSQIKDMPNSYVAADNLEIGFGNKIPLWMFGLLY